LLLLASICIGPATAAAQYTSATAASAQPDDGYPPIPSIPAIGVRNGRYFDLPVSAGGPPVDAAKGFRLQDLGAGLYLITDDIYQSMFLAYDRGVVVIDAPPDYAARIPQAIAEVTDKPITHLVYSHSHTDHIGGAKSLGGHPVIIAQQETRLLLARAGDPNRPLPTITFADRYTLRVGGKTLELSYHGDGHEPGNIFIYAPAQRVLMAVDLVFPGWTPWRRFAVAHDIPGYYAQVEEIGKLGWQTLVGGHVTRTGTHADVEVLLEFMRDVKHATAAALAETEPADTMDPRDRTNAWAVFDKYIDRVATRCVDALTPRWATRLAAFDVYIWDQCYAMEQSLRID
jgi:glyoxylase-like metal-dependent hydrolase (beta-lactamase superfamily II)